MSWSVSIIGRDGKSRQQKLAALPAYIGRDPMATIALEDSEASRKHAQLEESGGQIRISDLGSANGTFVNGRRITAPTLLTAGDRVKIGGSTLELAEQKMEVTLDQDTGARRLDVLQKFALAGAASSATASGGSTEGTSGLLVRIGGDKAGEEGRRAIRRLELLGELARALSTAGTLDEILNLFLEAALDTLPGVDRAAVLLTHPERGTLELVASKSTAAASGNLMVSMTISQHVFTTGEAVVTEAALKDARFQEGQSVVQSRIGFVVAAPIMARRKTIGVLYCGSRQHHSVIEPRDLEFLAILGSLVAAASLAHAQLDRKA